MAIENSATLLILALADLSRELVISETLRDLRL